MAINSRPVAVLDPRRRMDGRPALILLLAAACGGGEGMADARPPPPDAAVVDDGVFVCPQDGVRGSGRHRLFLQGHGAEPDADGVYPMLHQWDDDGGDARLCNASIFVHD